MDEKKKLSNEIAGLMLGVAVFFDALQFFLEFIPFLGQALSVLIDIFAFMTFWLWLRTYGIKFSSPKRAGTMAAGFLIELIPFLNMLPVWTLAVFILIADTRTKQILSRELPEVQAAKQRIDAKKARDHSPSK